FLIKPNREELARTFGRDSLTDEELVDAMQKLNEFGAEWVLVTDGKNPVHVTSAGQVWRIPPLVREVVNPIGCGDCMAAGIAWAPYHGRDAVDTSRLGMAVAADKVGRLLPGEVDRASVEALVSSWL